MKKIIYGRSIGTGIAAKLAADNNPKLLILETPPYSLEDLARHHMPLVPHKLALKYKLQTNKEIVRVKCPVHLFHGTGDNVVPYDASKRLLDLIKTNGELTTIEGGTHNDLPIYDIYQEKLKQMLL